MCTFITATINADANRHLVDETFSRLGYRFVDAPHPKDLPKERLYLEHMGGHCDCGTPIGSSIHKKPAYTPSDIHKLRNQGWSESKIERWKEQKLLSEEKNERSEEDRLKSAHRDLSSWVELIQAMLQTPSVKICGLMHDFYSSGPGYDNLPITVEPIKPVEELDEAFLYRLHQGVLAEWTR